ncbi:unnamed protein product [Fusarium graminearum]|uniref:Opsin-like protein carO n=2 Tax=Gibberella zeae (strain ATCC MYA-4620 / CBS 123657 / FGSC 9075 / NRRL 31084 / PH-1) TaxID=229533 RepID=A0A1C3YMJ9_GIBZE|nr:unnamed protein product [Fusarium graminearum]
MRVVILNQMVDQLCDSRLEDLAERPMLLDCCPLQIDATVTGNLLAGLDRLGTTRVMKTRGCGPAFGSSLPFMLGWFGMKSSEPSNTAQQLKYSLIRREPTVTMAEHLHARNDALKTNGFTFNGISTQINITPRGSDWYFTVCAVMTVSSIVFVGMGLRKPRTHRVFHYITASITMVAAIAYFTMGANLGWAPTEVEFHRRDHEVAGNYREIFYVRYIDWFITTPLLLMDLLLTAGMPWPTVLYVILVDEIMIVTGLVGALVTTSYKWGYFTIGCVALVYIVYQLAWEARIHANHVGPDVGRVFLWCGSLTAVVWILYPIAWGVCEGGNLISPDSEAVFYGILDIIAKPVFGAILLFGHRNIDPARLGLRIRDVNERIVPEGPNVKPGQQRNAGNVNAPEGSTSA